MTLKNNYQKLMDEVSLSEDQKEQMLGNIMRADLTPVRRRRSWKPVYAFLAMGACALVILPRIMPMGMSGGAAPMLAESAVVAEDKMISDDAAVQNTALGAMAAEPADSLPAEEESLADAGDPLIEALPFAVVSVTQDYHEERTLTTYEGEENTLYLTEVPEAVWKRNNDSGAISLPNEKEGMVSYGLAEKDGMVYVLEFAEPVPVETMEGLLERIRE
ncbi:MAG: hypothetical protein IKE68_07690 [Solobacterium sp.]|nr:hypothetical protein [Solobacterium sp.]